MKSLAGASAATLPWRLPETLLKPRNPDPSAEVRYGQQSWDEMMIGFFDVAVPAEMGKPDYFVR